MRWEIWNLSKVLLFSHSGFSDENANGITMKNLLSAWSSEEKAEFYCDVQPPDFSAAHDYFRVTDMQMLTAFVGKKAAHIFKPQNMMINEAAVAHADYKKIPSRIPTWLKHQKYNFFVKWLREIMWEVSPWGHTELDCWIDDFSPDALIYMVGESIFMDHLVLRTAERMRVPLVLYNSEAYRIIDLKERTGLERAYYREIEKLYQKLNQKAVLVIYNCELLQSSYADRFHTGASQTVAYNSASTVCSEYHPHEPISITYFGNLGVGRVDSLLQIADILREMNVHLSINVYGTANEVDEKRLCEHSNICYHGFVSSSELQGVIEQSDILLHVESFVPEIVPKLRYAFSTKIAQCLCAGRPVFCYAPDGSASVEYLKKENGALVATNLPELKEKLRQFISNPELRMEYADRALQLGKKNHQRENTAVLIRRNIEELI